MKKRGLIFLLVLFIFYTLKAETKDSELELYGVIKGKSFSSALFKTENRFIIIKEGERYGNFKLLKIYENKVEVKEGDSLVWLYFYGITKPILSQKKEIGKNHGFKKNSTMIYSLKRRKVKEYLHNLDKILYSARATPYFKDGKIEGFKIDFIDKGSLIDKLGIRDGDIIVSVNGKKLTTVEDALYFLNSFYSLKEIRIGILRGGKEVFFVYKIKE